MLVCVYAGHQSGTIPSIRDVSVPSSDLWTPARCGDKQTLQCLTEDGQKGCIMKNGIVESNTGKLVLESVTKNDEGLYECFITDPSIPARRYNVILSESETTSCK